MRRDSWMRRDRSRGESSEDCPMARGLVLDPLIALHIWTVYASLRAFRRKRGLSGGLWGESESRTPGEGFHD